MAGKKLFLTGGTGFFGKWLLQTLPPNLEATVLSRDPAAFLRACPQFRRPEIHFLTGDIRSFLLPDIRFDYVIHAATTSSRPIPDEEMKSVILDGTARVGKLDFGRMLYVSSGAVYGVFPAEAAPVPEDHPARPATVYGQAKLAAEELMLSSGRPVSVARCFAFVGPYLKLDGHFAIGNFIRDCLLNRPIIIQGDGRPVRSYLYAADLAEWLWRILLAGENGRIYNVGSEQGLSIRELAERVRRLAGGDNSIEVLSPPGSEPPGFYVPSTERARRELGLFLKTDLDCAIRKTLEFYRHET